MSNAQEEMNRYVDSQGSITYLQTRGASQAGPNFRRHHSHIHFNEFIRHHFDPIHEYERIWSTLDPIGGRSGISRLKARKWYEEKNVKVFTEQ